MNETFDLSEIKGQRGIDTKLHTVLQLCYIVLDQPSILLVSIKPQTESTDKKFVHSWKHI